MYDFIKTIISAIQQWVQKEIRQNVNSISIPIPNWNENDPNADGYIENRTHWEEIEEVTLIPEMSVFITDDGGYKELGEFPQLQIGQTYNVILNGIRYTCIARQYQDSDALIGNGTIYGDDDIGNNEPFSCDSYTDGSIYLNVTNKGMYTISISIVKKMVIHKIDSKYLDLPDNIATTDDVQEALDVASAAQTTADNKMNKSDPTGTGSFSMNRSSDKTIGQYSHAEGYHGEASGSYSHAEGQTTKATGSASHSEGFDTTASGTYSHAEGSHTTASGYNSHAEGYFTTASGQYSHTEGFYTTTLGSSSHAAGRGTIASRSDSYVSGRYNIPDSNYTIDYVTFTTNKTHNLRAEKSSSYYIATDYEISENGDFFVLKNPILVDGNTLYSQYNTYKGYYVLFEQDRSSTSSLTHRFVKNESSGQYIFQLSGSASNYNQYLFDIVGSDFTKNVLYVISESTYAHIVGNGTADDARSNAHTLDWDGNAWYQGDVYVGGTSQDDGEVLAKMSEVIPTPTTAAVGQTIAVKAVDENGKPTEWEAVNISGGGAAGGSSSFPTMVDNIVIEEEGVTSITLNIDLTACKEARFYISVPANNSGGTKNYYVASANVVSSNNMGWLRSYTDKPTGTTVYYKGISETLGDFSFASGMQYADISKPAISGGTINMTAVKSPRTVSDVTKLIWADAASSFPIGTRIQTFIWG